MELKILSTGKKSTDHSSEPSLRGVREGECGRGGPASGPANGPVAVWCGRRGESGTKAYKY